MVKISQFKFLVMTEQNIFLFFLQTFFSLDISDFSYLKIAKPLSSLSQQSPTKNWDSVEPLFFEILLGGLPLFRQKGGGEGVH